jgi:hypothetical protein
MADNAHIQTDKELERMERHLSAIYSRAEKEIEQKADDYFKKFEKLDAEKRKLVDGGKLTEKEYKAWRKGKIMQGKHWTAMKEQISTELLNANKTAVSYMNGQLPEVYSLNYNSVGEGVSGEVKGYSFELVDASTVKNLATSDSTLLPYKKVDGKKDVRWNTQKINAEVLQGIIQGDSIPNMAKRLRNVTEMNRVSAIRNARTMATSAENKGRMDSLHTARDKGVLMKKVWLATSDARTREAHAELDGQEQDIDSPFDSILGPINYPGDPEADPANVYQCRCTLTYKVVGFGKEQSNIPEETGIEQLREIAEASEDKYDFWMSLDENQQAIFKASGISLDDAFSTLHSARPVSEWKSPNPGGPESFSIKHDFSDAKVEFNPVKARSKGWMADATSAGVINVREDGLGDSWEFIISHEAGHQLSNFSDEIQQTILMNPGNVLGRYNTRVMAFDGVYGEYNPEEAFATCVSNYVRHPNSMKEKYPDAYDAIDRLFAESPSALDFVLRTMKEYERRFR